MRILYFILFLTFIIQIPVRSQTKKELEEKRNKTLEEINYVDNLLKYTEKEKDQSLNAVKIISSKLVLRESVIKDMRDEINLLSDRIDLNTLAIDLMESDLGELKRDYSKAIVNSYITKKGNPELVYILSAKDFNQGYKRIKYLQQLSQFRRNESEIIFELKKQIELSKINLQTDLNRVSDLKRGEENQKLILQKEKGKKQQMASSLTKKEVQLKKDLEDKKRIARKIEAEITKIIEEEKRKLANTDRTPEQKLIGDNFLQNKGRLPWPVESGIITGHFGIHQNAVLKNVEEKNIDLEITSSGKSVARTIFNGEVARIFPISGANMTVFIRHGKYISVYTNLLNLKVKTGDKVATKQEIGDIYFDTSFGVSVLKFMICENKDILDPEDWLAKKR